MEITKKSIFLIAIAVVALINLIGTISIAAVLRSYIEPVYTWVDADETNTLIRLERSSIAIPIVTILSAAALWFFATKKEGVTKMIIVALIVVLIVAECAVASDFVRVSKGSFILRTWNIAQDKIVLLILSDKLTEEQAMIGEQFFNANNKNFLLGFSSSAAAFCSISYILLIMIIIYWAEEYIPDFTYQPGTI